MKEPTLKEIIEARDKCATIIAKYGERYLPIFERLEKEIEIRMERQKSLEKALDIATQNNTQNATQIDKQRNVSKK
ncbi:MAG TPA: hypothetical protein VIN07_07440 [Flavipsychrobacter sp.]